MSTLPTGTAGQAVIDAARELLLMGDPAGLPRHLTALRRALEAYETQPRTHTTQPGESVMGIALRQCGNENEWRHILACNPEFAGMLPHEYFPVGTVLTLPPTPAAASPVEPPAAAPADYEEVLADHRRLVRELDVLLNGEEGAAKQASLCDIVAQVRRQKDDRAAVIQALQKALAYWMPKVFDERSAHDAYLLVGYEGETEESWGEKVQAELDRLNAIINTPHTDDFLKSVSIEAEHQRQRWDDSGKTHADWFWLVGYLAGKALNALIAGDQDKAEHHVITTAAALANWHRVLRGAGPCEAGEVAA
ncbi:hypothetical protein DC1_0003 [Burkholderia phage DC1]|uniref:LysM domain-containing protein n=1 Tax=Burkholderia phage DC1 TaxID=2881398 RepID=I6NVL3_9CAUD|nr:hypothetical protein B862_gp03 [Burkholderia phage DC1]AEZ50825.1 hypothetical protein DC1_0003 [Burkholderia phage DC1]